MRKVFKLDEIDCAVCAGKLEDAIKKLDGVQDAKINFLTQKLTLEAAGLRDPALRRTRCATPADDAERTARSPTARPARTDTREPPTTGEPHRLDHS